MGFADSRAPLNLGEEDAEGSWLRSRGEEGEPCHECVLICGTVGEAGADRLHSGSVAPTYTLGLSFSIWTKNVLFGDGSTTAASWNSRSAALVVVRFNAGTWDWAEVRGGLGSIKILPVIGSSYDPTRPTPNSYVRDSSRPPPSVEGLSTIQVVPAFLSCRRFIPACAPDPSGNLGPRAPATMCGKYGSRILPVGVPASQTAMSRQHGNDARTPRRYSSVAGSFAAWLRMLAVTRKWAGYLDNGRARPPATPKSLYLSQLHVCGVYPCRFAPPQPILARGVA
jgi:hypothetical protein